VAAGIEATLKHLSDNEHLSGKNYKSWEDDIRQFHSSTHYRVMLLERHLKGVRTLVVLEVFEKHAKETPADTARLIRVRADLARQLKSH